ncbi:MAG: IS200/IS605 family transposase [Chloroflexales bacterium]|nr:IS200/IS605 family transposase [Chloroflexales bacterium]
MELQQVNKTCHTDHRIVYSCQYHVIFGPKYRRKVLTDAVAARMKALVRAKQADYGYTVIAMELMPDHGHLLRDVDPRAGMNVVVGTIKGFTSHELRDEVPRLKKRRPTRWTRRKFISTVGAVTLAVVPPYIEHQQGV